MAKLVSRLNLIAENVDGAVSLAVQDTANFILTLIRIYAPVDTGWLRDSYKKETITPLHILVGTMVNYSVHQEFGTYKMAAQPHFLPAFWQGGAIFRASLLKRMRELS